jgi:uncharacterized protein
MNNAFSNGKKTALITGASGGIGLELARVFAREGCNLVLVARSESKLNELAAELGKQYGIQTKIIAKDLSQSSAPDEIFKDIQELGIQVDVLVNNAGFAEHGLFATESDWRAEQQMMQVNMIALTHLTKLFVQPMVERRDGKILNMGSTGSFAPGPLMAVYDATKAYVLSFSEALGVELHGTGVSVTALCPGATKTGAQERAGIQNIRYVQRGMMRASVVAEQGYRALMAGKPVAVIGLYNRLSVLVQRFLPRQIVARMVMYLQSKG